MQPTRVGGERGDMAQVVLSTAPGAAGEEPSQNTDPCEEGTCKPHRQQGHYSRRNPKQPVFCHARCLHRAEVTGGGYHLSVSLHPQRSALPTGTSEISTPVAAGCDGSASRSGQKGRNI